MSAFRTFGFMKENIVHDSSNHDLSDSETDESDIDDYNGVIENEQDFDKRTPSLPEHLRCAAHTLNLCASSDFKKILNGFQSVNGIHKRVIRKCNNLWKAASQPKSAEIIENTVTI
ncbi:hypothetical protein ABEB36_000207 [Hypothenemus hampei]|uniref:Uncharacterized protein n=1 Tax=Hypothenemus hampei TaxID=57062 RepID=A0ABD1FE62_HYPHA